MRKAVFLLLISVLMLAACGGGENSTGARESATPVPVPSEYAGLTNPLGADSAKEGVEVFITNCAMCHGPQGHGDGPAGQSLNPPPRNLAELQTGVSDDFLFWRIREGKPGTSMLAWKGMISDEQIWQIVSFIRTLK